MRVWQQDLGALLAGPLGCPAQGTEPREAPSPLSPPSGPVGGQIKSLRWPKSSLTIWACWAQDQPPGGFQNRLLVFWRKGGTGGGGVEYSREGAGVSGRLA